MADKDQETKNESTDSSEQEKSEAEATTRVADEPAADESTEAEQPEAETEEEEKIPYTLGEVQDLPESVKRIQFEVDWSEYDKLTASQFEEIQKNANIEGFRRGKAPMGLVRVRFGRDVEKEAVRDIMSNCLSQIIEEMDTTAYRFFDEELPKPEKDQPLKFAVSAEIKPKLEPSGYDSFDVEIEEVQAGEEVVDQQLEDIRRANATTEDKSALEPIGESDILVLDTRVTNDKGEEIEDLTWTDRQIQNLNWLPNEVKEAIIGKKKGEHVSLDVPNKRESEGGVILSETDHWSVEIKEVKELKMPELDDEFARDVGDFKDLDDLKKRIRKDLEQQKESEERTRILEKVHEQLIERNEFEIPNTMLRYAQAEMLRGDMQRLQQMGLTFEALGQSAEEYEARLKDNAERYLRVQLLLEAIGEKESVEVTDEDVDAELNRMAERAGRRPLAIRAQLEAQQRWESFKNELSQSKVADLLIERANVKKNPPAKKST